MISISSGKSATYHKRDYTFSVTGKRNNHQDDKEASHNTVSMCGHTGKRNIVKMDRRHEGVCSSGQVHIVQDKFV